MPAKIPCIGRHRSDWEPAFPNPDQLPGVGRGMPVPCVDCIHTASDIDLDAEENAGIRASIYNARRDPKGAVHPLFPHPTGKPCGSGGKCLREGRGSHDGLTLRGTKQGEHKRWSRSSGFQCGSFRRCVCSDWDRLRPWTDIGFGWACAATTDTDMAVWGLVAAGAGSASCCGAELHVPAGAARVQTLGQRRRAGGSDHDGGMPPYLGWAPGVALVCSGGGACYGYPHICSGSVMSINWASLGGQRPITDPLACLVGTGRLGSRLDPAKLAAIAGSTCSQPRDRHGIMALLVQNNPLNYEIFCTNTLNKA